MTLPLLISLPHAGLTIPPEIRDICTLTPEQIIEDGDEGAGEIYGFPGEVLQFVTTPVARAIVDMNRAEDDFRKDGVVKTHTCWDVPVYRTFPSEDTVASLIETYHRPYHSELSRVARGAILGIDCHTMVAVGPPVGPDPGATRPQVCLSHADGTCPDEWIQSLAACFNDAFSGDVSINDPFKGGYITRRHASELPWVQLELSRAPFASNSNKRGLVLSALRMWCQQR